MAEQPPAGSGTEHQPTSFDRWSRPPALSGRGYVLAVAIPVLIASLAFGVVALVSAGDDTRSGTTVLLPVSGWGPGADAATTPIQGVLRLDDQNCVYLESGQDGAQAGKVWPVWPSGFHAYLDHNRLTIYDSDDDAVAVDGNQVQMTGGLAPVGNFATEPCLPESGDVAVVQSEITVVQ